MAFLCRLGCAGRRPLPQRPHDPGLAADERGRGQAVARQRKLQRERGPDTQGVRRCDVARGQGDRPESPGECRHDGRRTMRRPGGRVPVAVQPADAGSVRVPRLPGGRGDARRSVQRAAIAAESVPRAEQAADGGRGGHPPQRCRRHARRASRDVRCQVLRAVHGRRRRRTRVGRVLCPVKSIAIRSGTPARIKLRAAVRRQSCNSRWGTCAFRQASRNAVRHCRTGTPSRRKTRASPGGRRR